MSIYYRDEIGGEDARVYDIIAAGLREWRQELTFSTTSELAQVLAVFGLVLVDNPDIFHVASNVSGSSFGNTVAIRPDYLIERSQANAYWLAIDRHVRDYKSLLSPAASEYEKVEKAYEYIIRLCEYGKSTNDQSMCSVLVDEISCCMGYSKAMSFLLSNVGICAPVISGDATSRRHRTSGGHAWNAVRVDGCWSLCDATWGDPVVTSGQKRGSDISYDYLCVPERLSAGRHRAAPELAALLPRCDDESHRWYVQHHLLFSDYDVGLVTSAVQADVLSRELGLRRDGDGDAYIQFDNERAFLKAKDFFIVDVARMIAPVYRQYHCRATNFSYTADDEMLSIHVRYDIVSS